MKRSNRWFIYAVLVPAILGGFLRGWQRARAANCIACDCKEVIRWRPIGTLGANMALGMKTAGTTTDALIAIMTVSSGVGCQSNPPTGSATYDQWIFSYCAPVCTFGNPPPALVEMTCNDTGSVMSRNLNRAKNCS